MSDDPCFVKGLAALNHMVCGPPEPEDDGCEECERLRAELEEATKWNHSVRVCKDHTADIVDGECVICDLEKKEFLLGETLEQLRFEQAEVAEKDKRIEDLERALAHSDNEWDAFQSHYYRVCDELAQETSAKITAEALVLGHEGHIETLDKRIAELERGIPLTGPHPWYGPCDGFGPKGTCQECKEVREHCLEHEYMYITKADIDAVVEFANSIGRGSPEWKCAWSTLKRLGIVTCEECGGSGKVYKQGIVGGYRAQCPSCHGHRWKETTWADLMTSGDWVDDNE